MSEFKIGDHVEYTGHNISVVVEVLTTPTLTTHAGCGVNNTRVFIGRVLRGENYDLEVGDVDEFVTLNFRRVSGVADE